MTQPALAPAASPAPPPRRRGVLATLFGAIAAAQAAIGNMVRALPGYPQVEAAATVITWPARAAAGAALRAMPWLRRWEPLFEVQRLQKFPPVMLAITLLFTVWRGLRTTNNGHISTDTLIYPLLSALSSFNPFLGVLSAGAFAFGDLLQKIVYNDIYGTGGRDAFLNLGARDANYWGALVGYMLGYSAVIAAGLVPGVSSRVGRLAVRKTLHALFARRVTASADGAAGADAVWHLYASQRPDGTTELAVASTPPQAGWVAKEGPLTWQQAWERMAALQKTGLYRTPPVSSDIAQKAPPPSFKDPALHARMQELQTRGLLDDPDRWRTYVDENGQPLGPDDKHLLGYLRGRRLLHPGAEAQREALFASYRKAAGVAGDGDGEGGDGGTASDPVFAIPEMLVAVVAAYEAAKATLQHGTVHLERPIFLGPPRPVDDTSCYEMAIRDMVEQGPKAGTAAAGGTVLAETLSRSRPRGGGRGGPPGRPPGLPLTPELEARLHQLDANIQDPDLLRRLEVLRGRAREDRFVDPAELAALEAAEQEQADRREAAIRAQQARNEAEYRERQRQEHAEEAKREAERQRTIDLVNKGRDLIVRETDPARRKFLEDLLARHARPNAKGGFDGDVAAVERAVQAIRDQGVEAQKQRNLGELEEAKEEAKAIDASRKYAEDVRDWSARVNRVIAKAAGPAGAKILDLQNFIYSGVQGYEEDGWRGAIGRAAANRLDNYTAGGGNVIYDAANRGATGTELARDYWENLRNQYDPSRIAQRAGDAMGAIDAGDTAGGLGGLIDAALDAGDAAEGARDLRHLRRHVHEHVDTHPAGTAGGGHAGSGADERGRTPRMAGDGEEGRRPAAERPGERRADGERLEPTTRAADDGLPRERLTPEDKERRRVETETALREENDARRRELEAKEKLLDSGGSSDAYAELDKAKRAREKAQERLRAALDEDGPKDRHMEEPHRQLEQAGKDAAEAQEKIDRAQGDAAKDRDVIEEARRREEMLRRRSDGSPEAEAKVAYVARARAEAEERLRQGQKAEDAATSDRDHAIAERERARRELERGEADPRREMREARRERSGETPEEHDWKTRRDADADMKLANSMLERARERADKAAERLLRNPDDPAAKRELAEAIQRREEMVAHRDKVVPEWEKAGRERGAEVHGERETAQSRLEQANKDLESAHRAEQQARDAGAKQSDIDEAVRKREQAEAARDVAYDERVKAGEREREAATRMHTHLEAEGRTMERVDKSIRETFNLPEPGPEDRPGTLRIGDEREVQRQARALDPKDRGMLGFNEPGSERSRSVASEHVAIHERVHANASTDFDKAYPARGERGVAHLKEGITEHFARQVIERQQGAGGPVLPSTPAYTPEVKMVQALEGVVGRDKLANAYFNGNLGDMHTKLGEAFGSGNPEATGRSALAAMDVAMSQGKHDEVQKVLALLQARDQPGARAALTALSTTRPGP